MTKSDKNQLFYFESKILRKIFRPTRNSSIREYERRKNTESEELFNKPSIQNMLYANSLNGLGTCGEQTKKL